jgi:Cu(I)/Ag(I) efflux system membrane fusion protein
MGTKKPTDQEPIDRPSDAIEHTASASHADPPSSTTDANTAPPTGASAKLRERLTGWAWLGRIGVQAIVLAAVGIGLIAGIGLAQRAGWITSGEPASTEQHAQGKAVYVCPMHPQIRMDQPGKCPICKMKLVLVTEQKASSSKQTGDDRYICSMMCTPASSEPGRCPVCAMELVPAVGGGAEDGTAVTIDPVARRLVGIRTAQATSKTVFQTIRTIGRISYDESKLATISAYVDGRIEKMYADYLGVPVKQNDDLALIYSPQLYSAQVEYLTTLGGGALGRLNDGDDSRMSEIGRENLLELGMTDQQIAELTDSRKANSRSRIKSPITGTVIEKHKVEGDYIKTGEVIYKVADLSTVWLMLDLYPVDAARIRFGQQVEAEIQAMPGQVFIGRVAFIDPTVDTQTRTVSVRVEMLNPGGKLRPGDYANAGIAAAAIPQDLVYDPALAGKYISPMHPQIILDQPGDCPVCGMDLIPTTELGYATEPIADQEVVVVPRQAVLMAGDNSVVYVETERGRFETRRVIVGPLSDTEAIIIEGLSVGEVVAVDGNFLIDSQMQLAGNPSLMDPSRASLYPPGPLLLPTTPPIRLSGAAAGQFDQAFAAYFDIARSLAADSTPQPVAMTLLRENLDALLASSDVPDPAQTQLNRARRALAKMTGPLDQTRRGFRIVSHALLRAAAIVRGEATAEQLIHFYCPMVPGGGGDWMQPDGDLRNPYWGSEMLQCGEQVTDMKIKPATEPVQ